MNEDEIAFIVCVVFAVTLVVCCMSAYNSGSNSASALVCSQYCDTTGAKYDFVENRCVCITITEKFQGE
jgi:hypothetical protein